MTPNDNGNGGPLPNGKHSSGELVVPQRVHNVIQPVPGTLAPAASSQVPLALELLKAFRRRWVISVALGTLCASIAAAVVWSVVPPAQYTAQARFHVSAIPPRIIFPTAETHVDYPTFQRTQLALIRSQLVLNAALRRIGGMPVVREQVDPIVWLERKIQAGFDGEILRIAVSDTEPEGLAEIVNAVKDAYLSEVVDKEKLGRRERFEDLEKIFSDYQAKLEKQRETLHSLGQNIGTTDEKLAQITHEMTLERRHMAQRELFALQSRLREARIERDVLRTAPRAGGAANASLPRTLVDEHIRHDPRYKKAEEYIEELRSRHDYNARMIKRPSDPVLRDYREQIEWAERERDDLKVKLSREYAAQGAGGVVGTRDETIAELDRQIRIFEELEFSLNQEIAKLDVESDTINTNYVDLGAIKAEIAKMEDAADRVGAEVEALRVELNAPDRFEEIEKADTPRAESDKRLKMAAMGGGGAFALVLLAIAWLEHQARRIDSVDEVAGGLGLRVMGSLPPRDRPTGRRRLRLAAPQTTRPDQVLIESIDAARTHLLHEMRHHAIRSLMVTSAMGGEGKTSLACHLAASIARSGRNTLLIDSDLRKPSLHDLFDQPLAPGFSELLRGQAQIEDVIRPGPAEGLWMITAGQWDRKAVEALSRDEARALIDRLTDRFDFVVVDTPPVLLVADALLVGQHLDAALCSILRGVSRTPRVRAANERLLTLGIHVLGAVVSGVHDEVLSIGYQYQETASA
jgi:capsular exopolysaccharide synthesis family protein